MQECVALLQLALLGLRIFRAVGHFEFFHGAAPRGLAPNVFTHTPPHSWQSPAITHHLALAVRGPSQSPASLLSVGTHGRCCWAAGVVLSCVSAPPHPPSLLHIYTPSFLQNHQHSGRGSWCLTWGSKPSAHLQASRALSERACVCVRACVYGQG